MADGRGFTAGRYSMDLAGVTAGWLQSVEGGGATSDVVSEKLGPDHIVHKHLAGVKYEDITVNCGAGMAKNFYEWIKASFDHKHMRKDGSIHSCDYDGNIKSTLDFFHALITEIGFPACDAASKDAAKLVTKFAIEHSRKKKGSGKGELKVDAAKAKRWTARNFKLEVAGLDCTHVNKVEAITVKQKVVEHAVGEMRDYQKEPANLEVPNLVVTLSEHTSEKWDQWHHDFVILGQNEQGKEKTGALHYLSEDLKTTLFTIDFFGLGIFKATHDKHEAGGENIKRCKYEMYCENVAFKPGDGIWA
jgi:phage tail-like protein